jgi:AAA domain
VDNHFATHWQDLSNDQSNPESSPIRELLLEELGDQDIRKLTGTSFLELASRSVTKEAVLLGEKRYLSRGGGAIVVGPSGVGKSVLAAQMTIEWGCGKASFGIRPARPLRIILIQAEDDEGDLIEMSQIVHHLELSEEEKLLVASNTHVEFVNDVTGESFLKVLDGFLTERPFDLIIANPYSAYLGADIKDDGANARFLRNGLNPILTEHGCGIFIIHHTPKMNYRDTSDWKQTDWMYAGAGAAVLTNWARAYLVIEPTSIHGVYRFIAAKRGQRIGWPRPDLLWSHAREEGKLLWVPADSEQAAAAKENADRRPEDVLTVIPEFRPITQDQFFLAAKGKGVGVNRARTFVNVLMDEGRVHAWKIKRPNRKPAIGYARRPQPEA